MKVKEKLQNFERSYVLFRVVIFMCTATFIFSSVMLYRSLSEYKAGREVYEAMQSYVMPPLTPDEQPAESTSSASIEEFPRKREGSASGIILPSVDFEALRSVNQDVAAWLISGDGTINYPVVKGEDNSFYLEHLFDGTPGKSGCLFIDCDNKRGFTDYNTVIYGHNMKDGSMFKVLNKYNEQAYYDDNPQMLLLTPEGNYTLELFAGYITEYDDVAWTKDFEDENEFGKWLDDAREKSAFTSAVQFSSGSRAATLITCTNNSYNTFFVVTGLLKPQEEDFIE